LISSWSFFLLLCCTSDWNYKIVGVLTLVWFIISPFVPAPCFIHYWTEKSRLRTSFKKTYLTSFLWNLWSRERSWERTDQHTCSAFFCVQWHQRCLSIFAFRLFILGRRGFSSMESSKLLFLPCVRLGVWKNLDHLKQISWSYVAHSLKFRIISYFRGSLHQPHHLRCSRTCPTVRLFCIASTAIMSYISNEGFLSYRYWIACLETCSAYWWACH